MPAPKLKRPAAEPAPPAGAAYERDFYTWSLGQADALRSGRWRDLDVANLAEEIEDLGKETFYKLESAYRIILVHMLKWDHQPERRSRSWAGSIAVQRLQAGDLLGDNPGLQGRRDEALLRAYRKARVKAAVETKKNLAILPEACPYSPSEIMTRPFDWPER